MATIKEEIERARKLAAANAELQEMMDKPDTYGDVMTRVMGREYKPLTQATPYEEVLANYTLPFELYPFQVKSVNELGPELRSGLYFQPGTGKTVTSTTMTLYKFIVGMADRAVVIMPPILLTQWCRFLEAIPGVTVQVYRGTPAVRKRIKLGETLFTLVGAQIFKIDYDRFVSTFGPETAVIRDEAHDVKRTDTENYKKFSKFVADKSVNLLTGTPISSPEDGYAYIKILAPTVYRSRTQYLNVHAGERDFWNKVISWKNMDMLAENMGINTHRVLITDVIKDLPELTYTPIFYQLEPGHRALYKQLAEEQLLQIGEGKLDATSTGKLLHALGQIICNYDYFSNEPKNRSACFDLIDQIMEELGPTAKLAVFAKYRITNRKLLSYLQPYGAVAVYGGQTGTQNQAAVDMFVGNPECRVIVIQPTSGGIGVDGLQDVCRDGLFLEYPSVRDFHQAVARLHRAGQKNGVHIRVATAEGTLQVRDQKNLLEKDSLVNQIIRNKGDLRDAIFGE